MRRVTLAVVAAHPSIHVFEGRCLLRLAYNEAGPGDMAARERCLPFADAFGDPARGISVKLCWQGRELFNWRLCQRLSWRAIAPRYPYDRAISSL